MNLGEKLFELRKSKNLTQDEVAEKLNVTRQTISKWETDQSSPDFDKIAPLCELYGVTPNELLTDVVDIKKEKESKKEAYENMTSGQIRQKTAEVVSSSILMFFVGIIAIVVGVGFLNLNAVLCVGFFLLMVALGVTNMIRHFVAIPKVEKTEEEKNEDKIAKQICDIISIIGLIIYFIVSFATMAWHITWIIFIIVGLANQIVKLIFSLNGKEVKEDE